VDLEQLVVTAPSETFASVAARAWPPVPKHRASVDTNKAAVVHVLLLPFRSTPVIATALYPV